MATVKFDGTVYRTYGDLPDVGSHAPDFSLVNTKLQNVTLANWSGKRKVLNIFVSVDRPICAKSVIEFDSLGNRHDDVAMLMVSYDLPFAHARFGQQHDLQNVVGLSAIRHAGFGENYGVLIETGPLAGMYARAIVVLDENNTVVHRQQIEDITVEPDYGTALRALGIRGDKD